MVACTRIQLTSEPTQNDIPSASFRADPLEVQSPYASHSKRPTAQWSIAAGETVVPAFISVQPFITRLSPHEISESHRRSVRHWTLAFVLILFAFLFCLDLPLWMLSGSFWSSGNLALMSPMLLIVLGTAMFRIYRLSADGPTVAKLLGGTRLDDTQGNLAVDRFRNVAEELAIAVSVLPVPELFVLKSESRINAFAAGSSSSKRAICVSQGALDRLSRDELQGVVAHEMAHLRHDDVRLSVRLSATLFGLLAVMITGVFLLQAAATREVRSKTEKENSEEMAITALFLAVGIFIIIVGGLGWLTAALLDAKISRQQEMRADAEAVRLTSSSAGLTGALVKLYQESDVTGGTATDRAGAMNPLYFRSGVKKYWFDTHPPLLDRIRALDPSKAAELEAARH